MTTAELIILDRGIVAAGYTNHVADAADAQGNMFAAFTQSLDGEWPDLLIRRRQRGTGVWSDLHRFAHTDKIKYGYATLRCLGRHLVVLAPERQLDGTNPTREYIFLNVCEPLA